MQMKCPVLICIFLCLSLSLSSSPRPMKRVQLGQPAGAIRFIDLLIRRHRLLFYWAPPPLSASFLFSDPVFNWLISLSLSHFTGFFIPGFSFVFFNGAEVVRSVRFCFGKVEEFQGRPSWRAVESIPMKPSLVSFFYSKRRARMAMNNTWK